MIKIVSDELTMLMGEKNSELSLNTAPPAVILVAGLQGAGKTTTVAKLANHLAQHEKKSVMVTSCDIYRPAAIKQLETLANQIQVGYHSSLPTEEPLQIAKKAIDAAKKSFHDVLIIDTAGRLHIDTAMMDEIKTLQQATTPAEILFVADAMTGQDAANTAKAFHETLNLTGVILTKVDGDARGGAALSIRQITGKPIKFIGVGEKIDALEPFHPERVASRILGKGDVVSLVEQVQRHVDQDKAKKTAKKIRRGHFDLHDFRDQLQQMNNMGGIQSLIAKLPGAGAMQQQAMQSIGNNKQFNRMEALINSMTPKERQRPELLNGSMKRRICAGSGTQIQDLNRLLKQFKQMQKMMKKAKGGGMKKMMKNMHGMMGDGGFPNL